MDFHRIEVGRNKIDKREKVLKKTQKKLIILISLFLSFIESFYLFIKGNIGKLPHGVICSVEGEEAPLSVKFSGYVNRSFPDFIDILEDGSGVGDMEINSFMAMAEEKFSSIFKVGV